MDEAKILELARSAGLVVDNGQVRSSGCDFVLWLDLERFARLLALSDRGRILSLVKMTEDDFHG